jgi:hypothetical protein
MKNYLYKYIHPLDNNREKRNDWKFQFGIKNKTGLTGLTRCVYPVRKALG